jgi:hypothetical protein
MTTGKITKQQPQLTDHGHQQLKVGIVTEVKKVFGRSVSTF